jgi:hypothetical protein
MHSIHAIRRPADILAWLASILRTAITVAPAALASVSPGQARLLSWADPPLPPGWTKRPPLPAHVQALATGGMPSWLATLIAATAALLASALALNASRMRRARRRPAPSASGTTRPR